MDLALLEDICGHFARLKYSTSSVLSFPFVKELCRFAERAVELESASGTALPDSVNNDPDISLYGTYRSETGERDLGGVNDCGLASELTDISEVINLSLAYQLAGH